MQKLLVCEECMFYCCHTFCCNPPFNTVPIDPWYCQFCRPIQNTFHQIKEPLIPKHDSNISRSIRRFLNEKSTLKQLFESADQIEIENELFGITTEDSLFQSKRTTRIKRSNSIRVQSTARINNSRSNKKNQSRERSRSRTLQKRERKNQLKKNRKKTKSKV